jgi:hypothetical protein
LGWTQNPTGFPQHVHDTVAAEEREVAVLGGKELRVDGVVE